MSHRDRRVIGGWNTGSTMIHVISTATRASKYHQSACGHILFPHLRHARYGDVFHFVRQALAAVSRQQEGHLG